MYKACDRRYNEMEYRRCGESGIKIPAISLGLWQNFGENRPYVTSKEIVERAFDLGITHFDLANNYGPPYGSAERTFGKIMKDSLKSYRDELLISTKAGFDMWPGPYGNWGSKKYLTASLDQSLQRMGLDYVDIFYHHRPDPETPIEETMDALATLVRQGKALYVGISSYSAEQTEKAYKTLFDMGVRCLIHQPCYNMKDRWIENGLQDVLYKNGMGSIAFCPLAQGTLTSKYINEVPQDSRASRNSGLSQSITPEFKTKLKKLNDIASERGQTLAQMALAWVLRGGKVTSALIGASSVSQLEENVATIKNLDFTSDELTKIDQIIL
ncbi:MAG: L-glyceraldehyde 3-phosphate reductase [Oscillospiraceae bacterium]|nr:L-glyceraldehyde 3-phosphate reductase [Oscillospiraceae bacterium]